MNHGLSGDASYASAEGTVAHNIGHSILTGAAYEDCVGATVMQDGFDVVVTTEMIQCANEYAEYVKGLGGWQRYEQVVTLEWLIPGVWGTADAVVHAVEHSDLHVVDFKYGAGVHVKVMNNWQLLIYALAALGPDNWLDAERITMHIHQPRMGNVASWTVSIHDMPGFAQTLLKSVNAIRAAMTEPEQHLVPGGHCRWCPQRSTCKALQRTAVEKAQASFGVVQALPDVTISDILDHAELIDLWISSVRAEAYKRAERGECPGWKLVPTRPQRVWAADESAIVMAGANAGVNTHGPAPLLSPAQLEKLAGKVKYGQHFAPLVSKVSSGLKLVKADHPGTAVIANEVAAAKFGAVLEHKDTLFD